MKVPYRKVGSVQEVVQLLDPSTPVMFDTETVGLYGKLRLAQFYQKDLPHVLIVEWPDAMTLAALLNKFHLVIHNAHYDITVLQQQGAGHGYAPHSYDCTFLLGRLAFSDQAKFSLDDVFTYALGFDPYNRQGLVKAVMQKSKWQNSSLTDLQLQYAATDVFFMPQVWEVVKEYTSDMSYKLDKSTLQSCLKFQWHGMPIDFNKMQERISSIKVKLAETALPINVNSWQQVRAYLGTNSSDDLFLATLAIQGSSKAEQIRTVRSLTKQLSFMTKFEETATQDGRILGKFKPSARSGRLTSDDQNLQQLPRKLKGIFGVPADSGRVLIYVDYPQLELRTIAAITNCSAMIDLFRAGTDLHTYTSDFIFGTEQAVLASCNGDADKAKVIRKRNRQIAKTCNFSLLYGGGISMFISILIKTTNILITEQEAQIARKKWRQLWREVHAWQERGMSRWKKGLKGSTPLGRQYKAERVTDHLNIENQGAGAEVAKLALHYFMSKHLDKYNPSWDIKLCNFVHDSFILEVPDKPEVYKQVALDLARCCQLAWFEMSKCFAVKDLPMPINIGVGYNWGDIESDSTPNVYDYALEPYATLGEANAI